MEEHRSMAAAKGNNYSTVISLGKIKICVIVLGATNPISFSSL